MSQFPNAQCLVIFSRKAQANYAAKRLRDRNIVVGVRGKRGEYEVFGFVPDRMTLAKASKMALEFGMSR